MWRRNPGTNPLRLLLQGDPEIGSQFIALVYSFIFGFGIIAMSLAGKLFLHRYAIPIIPFAIIQLVLLAWILNLERTLCSLFIIGCLVSIYNHHGVLYKPTTAFSIVETSHAYKPYVLAQKTIINEIEKLDNDTPIYVSREIDYMTSHPLMGYIAAIKPNIEGIYKPQYADLSINQLSDRYYVVFTNRGHGGARIQKIIEQVNRLEQWHINETYRQNIGGYDMSISQVLRSHESE